MKGIDEHFFFGGGEVGEGYLGINCVYEVSLDKIT